MFEKKYRRGKVEAITNIQQKVTFSAGFSFPEPVTGFDP